MSFFTKHGMTRTTESDLYLADAERDAIDRSDTLLLLLSEIRRDLTLYDFAANNPRPFSLVDNDAFGMAVRVVPDSDGTYKREFALFSDASSDFNEVESDIEDAASDCAGGIGVGFAIDKSIHSFFQRPVF